MPGTYKTFMVDPLGALKPGLGSAIQTQLAMLFSPIVGYNNFFENNMVSFSPSAAAPVSPELLVYFMPSRTSIVKNFVGTNASVDLSADGFTAFSATASASEVYVKSDDPVLLARLAFHELMHNRLKMGENLHHLGGLAAAVIYKDTPLTDSNIKRMAAVLRSPITQWTAGISTLNSGKSDPLSEYYKV